MTNEYDTQIADLVHSILSHAAFVVETVNESRLVKLYELRGTPLPYKRTVRDIEHDWAMTESEPHS